MNGRSLRLTGVAVVLFAPLVGVLVLRAPLLNNLSYRDPWFYSGYGWTLAHHVEIFGWFYYSVRFPVILPIRWSTDLFGPVAGYLVLHYVILVATGAVLYACVRRFASATVACAAVLLLALNPFYMRMVLWDYTSYVALPCAIMAVALWLMASTSDRVFLSFVSSGALLGAAVFANAFSATFVAPLLLVEGVAVLRRGPREFLKLMARVAAAVVGAALVFIGGYLGYRAYLGAFSPHDLLEPTLEFMRQNDQRSAPFQRPAREFLEGEPRIYAPLLLCLASLVMMGRGLAEDTLRGRLAQFAIGYVAVLWLYRFVVTSAAVETWWAYNMVAISMCFAVPLILDQLERTTGRRDFLVAVGAALGGTAVATVLIRNRNASAVAVYDDVRDNLPVLLLALGIAVALVAALRLSRSNAARAAAACAFFAVVAAISLAPARYIGIGQTGEFAPHGRSELLGYQAAYDMAKLVEESDQPDSRTLLWPTLVGFPIVGWTNLPHQGGSISNAETPLESLHRLNPAELDLVRHPTTSRLLLLSQDPADMTRGMVALRRQRVRPMIRRRGSWGDGYLEYALVDVRVR